MKLLIYGTGSQAKLVYSELKNDKRYQVAGFTCDEEFFKADTFLDKKVFKFGNIEKFFNPEDTYVLSLGVFSSPRKRHQAYTNIKNKGYKFINFISKKAIIPKDIQIGENNVIFSGVYLDFFGKLGNNNVIRPNTYIGHNFEIGNGVYISPGCNIAGYCKIEDLSFVGIGSTIIERKSIAKETLIGAGSLIIKDTEPYSKYIGNPAKKTGEHKETGIIL